MKINIQAGNFPVTKKRNAAVVYADKSCREQEMQIVAEHFLDVYINDQLALKLVCTPQHLEELVLGRLVTEGFIQSIDDVELLYICESGNRAKVYVKQAELLVDTIQQEPTCCSGNQVFLKNPAYVDLPVLFAAPYQPEWIFQLAQEFVHGATIHKATKGTHSCYLAVNGEVVFASEDIGRHNAMDKVIGHALKMGYSRETCILYTTGRAPTDMVKKAIMARIPILVSKAVPTNAAVEMAEYYNLTLICQAWPDKYVVYHEGQ